MTFRYTSTQFVYCKLSPLPNVTDIYFSSHHTWCCMHSKSVTDIDLYCMSGFQPLGLHKSLLQLYFYSLLASFWDIWLSLLSVINKKEYKICCVCVSVYCKYSRWTDISELNSKCLIKTQKKEEKRLNVMCCNSRQFVISDGCALHCWWLSDPEEPIAISMLAVIFVQSGNHIAPQASGKAGEMRLCDCGPWWHAHMFISL